MTGQTSHTSMPMTSSFGMVLVAGHRDARLDEAPVCEVRRLYTTHGVALLRGFATDASQFDRLASQFVAEPVVNGNATRVDVVPERAIQTVNSGTDAIPLHAEMAYSPFRPDVLCFHCLQRPAIRTGETLLCDGVELWQKMPPHLRTIFEEAQIRYSFRRNRMLAVQAQGQRDRLASDRGVKSHVAHPDGTIDLEFVAPAVHTTRHGGARAFANSVIVEADSASFDGGGPISDAVRRELAIFGASLSYRLAWENGDVLVIDNSRVMHGRRRLAPDDGRKIVLKMGWEPSGRA
jgi:alpha-ketoglutarate-dependent taurine dioxygenase